MGMTSSMSMALSAQLNGSLDLGSQVTIPANIRQAVQLGAGTGAGKADLVFADRRVLAASASDSLDLAGSLVDTAGATITFARIKGLYVSADPANTNSVIIGAAASAPWTTLLGATGTVTLRPGSSFLVMAGQADATGYAVTATTADLLKIANSAGGTSVSYDLVLIGSSA